MPLNTACWATQTPKNAPRVLATSSAPADCLLETPERPSQSWFEKDNSTINHDEKEIKALISKRNEAKINKDYEKADAIRDDLMKNGIEIMDSNSK